MNARTPVHLLTGFLGSGKTTLLNRLLHQDALPNTAVVVNELGDVGIDHWLVEQSEDQLVELSGGCVCCAVREDLALTLEDLLARRDAEQCAWFDQFVIETTGVADPAPIINLLSTDPSLASRTELGRIITTVDGLNGNETLDRHRMAVKQVALADVVVLTKADLSPGLSQTADHFTASREMTPVSIPQRIERLNPRAAMTRAVLGNVEAPLETLFGPARDLVGEVVTQTFTPPETKAPASERIGVRGGPSHEPVHEHHHHADGIETFSLRLSEPIPGPALISLVETLAEQVGERLLRVKGLVELAEAPEQPVVLHGTQHVFYPLEPLPSWPPGVSGTHLVFITDGLGPTWFESLVPALVEETKQVIRAMT